MKFLLILSVLIVILSTTSRHVNPLSFGARVHIFLLKLMGKQDVLSDGISSSSSSEEETYPLHFNHYRARPLQQDTTTSTNRCYLVIRNGPGGERAIEKSCH